MNDRRVNSCLMPTPLSRDDAEIWQAIRDRVVSAYCDRRAKPGHVCVGRITMTHEHGELWRETLDVWQEALGGDEVQAECK